MATLVGLAALAALLLWAFTRRPRMPAPEDDATTPVDHEELARAERDLAADANPRELAGGWEDDQDDWGPGAP